MQVSYGGTTSIAGPVSVGTLSGWYLCVSVCACVRLTPCLSRISTLKVALNALFVDAENATASIVARLRTRGIQLLRWIITRA